MDSQELQDVISLGETLKVEFKSDLKRLHDREIVAIVVSLANSEGGSFFLGVEDDGTITGLHFSHFDTTGVIALIENKTNPSISIQIETHEIHEKKVLHILVPKSKKLVATSEGLVLRRRIMFNGKPETIPFYPHEFIHRQSTFGLVDASAMPLMELTVKDLNPLERLRLRETIKDNRGDTSLLSLSDDELDGVLGLVVNVNGVLHPTLAGLLVLGREENLRRYVPSYEIAFQVLEGTEVRFNEFFRKPLLQVCKEIESLFAARIVENELEIGLFRIAVPNFDKIAFREAFVNALIHRDYARLGAIHVQIDDHGLSISSPGGFVEGISLENLLVTKPHPRNPLLADIGKRLGLSDRTGRGIDRIYEGLLRYGRPAPNYSYSNVSSVVVQMSNVESDTAFLEMILREEKRIGEPLHLDCLIILSRLRHERSLSTSDLNLSIQKSEQETRVILERLVESGLIKAHGKGRGRTYTLSAKLYQKEGQKAEYVRQAGFDLIQQEQMIMSYLREYKIIKRGEAADLCHIGPHQASRLLRKLVSEGKIILKGDRKRSVYENSS